MDNETTVQPKPPAPTMNEYEAAMAAPPISAAATTTEEIKLTSLPLPSSPEGAAAIRAGAASIVRDRIKLEYEVKQEAEKEYDKQSAALPENMQITETKDDFVKRSIADAVVTVVTTTSTTQLPTKPENVEAAMAKLPIVAKNLAKQDTGMYLLEMGKAYGIAPKNVDKIQQNITALMAVDANYRGITDLKKWWNGLEIGQQALLAENWTPKSNWQLAKEVFYGMPLVSTVRAVQTRGFKSGWTWLSIGTDALILSPVISKAVGAIASPIKGFAPRIGVAPVGVANIAGSTYKVSRLILLPSKNAVAKFESLRSSIAAKWIDMQNKLPSATFKKGTDIVMRDDAIIKQLEGKAFRMVEVIENPLTKFTAVERLTAGQKLSMPWGYVTKKSPGIVTYTTPVDEALVKASDIKGISEIRYGEGGGYGREGQWSKAQFDAETQRVKVANLLESKSWEITPEVKAALQREKQAKTTVATAIKEKPVVTEKFKTITEKKVTTEVKTKTGAASETERLENIRRYAPRVAKKFTGVSPELTWAVATMVGNVLTFPVSTGKPMTISTPEIIRTTTTIMPDIQTIIKQVATGETAIDIVTKQAIEKALQKMAKENIQNMTDAQMKNMIEQQVRNAIRAQIEAATKTETKTELAQKLATRQAQIVRVATRVTTRIVNKIETTKPTIKIPFIPLLSGADGKPLTKAQIDASVGWKQGFMYRLKYPPYGEKNTIYSTEPIPGIPYHDGAGSAYASLVQIAKGKLPVTIKDDMGLFMVNITAKSIGLGKKAMEFERLPTRRHKKRNVRIVHPSKIKHHSNISARIK
jgi:hypothetical protein